MLDVQTLVFVESLFQSHFVVAGNVVNPQDENTIVVIHHHPENTVLRVYFKNLSDG